MVSYKKILEDFIDSLITIGADNLTLDLARDLIKENIGLYPTLGIRMEKFNIINEILKGRESIFAK